MKITKTIKLCTLGYATCKSNSRKYFARLSVVSRNTREPLIDSILLESRLDKTVRYIVWVLALTVLKHVQLVTPCAIEPFNGVKEAIIPSMIVTQVRFQLREEISKVKNSHLKIRR